jgi:hypothetical protein
VKDNAASAALVSTAVTRQFSVGEIGAACPNSFANAAIVPNSNRNLTMKIFGAALVALSFLTSTALCAESRFEAMLKRVDPSQRLEQVCEYAGLVKIGHDKNPYRPDRIVVDTLSPVRADGDRLSGTGAALRSKGRWYQFEFNCQATPDRMKVLHFDYRVGSAIPEEEWEKLGLWR